MYFRRNYCCDAMVCVFSLGTVDRGCDPGSGQTKDLKIGICWLSARHTVFLILAKTSCLGINIISQISVRMLVYMSVYLGTVVLVS